MDGQLVILHNKKRNESKLLNETTKIKEIKWLQIKSDHQPGNHSNNHAKIQPQMLIGSRLKSGHLFLQLSS